MTDDITRDHHDNPHAPPGPHTLPEPPSRLLKDGTTLSIKDVYLGDIGDHDQLWMPLYVLRLRKSYFFELATNEQLGAALRLWIAAWIANPAASMKAEPHYIAKVAGYDLNQQHNLLSWGLINRLVLHGWISCNDGRMYHVDLAEIALDQAEKLYESQKRMHHARASVGKGKRKSKKQKTAQSIDQSIAQSIDQSTALYRDRDIDKESSSRASAPDHDDSPSLRSEERKQAPASPAERGSATTEFADRPTSPPKAPPSGQAEPQTSNAGFIKEFGMTPKAMAEAMWQATTGSTRMGRNLEGLENIEPTITLIRSNPGLSFRDDVLSAITMASLRAGGIITSWRYFRDAILERYQNRIKGAGNGAAGPQGSGYEAGNPPKWWEYSEEKKRGEPPPGHPWQKRVFDEGKLRKYGEPAHWDWQWYDRVKKYTDTGGYPNGEWDQHFAKELPGRPGSSCPDDICAEFGIVPQARREGSPIIDMRVVREVQARRAEEARRGVIPMPPAPEGVGLAKAMGGLPTSTAGQLAQEDDAPPF